jgi:CO/xanthine dehydrogenase Mo-binding subunit
MKVIASRRDFILSGITFAFTLGSGIGFAQQRLPGSLDDNRRLESWIRIAADGIATVCTGKVELGQGIVTALAQIAAEELDLPLDRIRMISGDTELTPNEGVTAGSLSIEDGGVALRLAGAEVHAILLDLATKRLGTTAEVLRTADGVIIAPDGRTITYGELAAAVDLHREATAKAPPKPAAAHRIVGKPVRRFDIPGKVTGGTAYVQDLRIPGMLHGRVVRPPNYGAKLEAIEAARSKAIPGVSARRQLPWDHRRARRAGNQSERDACGQRAVDCRTTAAGSGPHLRSLAFAADRDQRREPEGGAPPGWRQIF